MRRKFAIVRAITSLICLGQTISCTPKMQNCCTQYSPGADQALYCTQHRSAGYEFVQNDDTSLSKSRLEQLRALVKKISDCSTVNCIEQIIRSDASFSRLDSTYTKEHSRADELTHLPEPEKVKLIICGFNNAIEDVEVNLKQE